jgi:hypothetical protein
MRVLLLASALVLSQASVCTDIDFDTADVTVSNFGADKYCCNICSNDASLLCCPTLDEDGSVARAIYLYLYLRTRTAQHQAYAKLTPGPNSPVSACVSRSLSRSHT